MNVLVPSPRLPVSALALLFNVDTDPNLWYNLKMTRDQAMAIINDLLDLTMKSTVDCRYDSLKSSPYPGLADIYRKYIYDVTMNSRDFYNNATEYVIVANTKLGKALK